MPPVAPTSEVTGIIRLAKGSPAAEFADAAVDRDLRTEQPLGATITARDGGFDAPRRFT